MLNKPNASHLMLTTFLCWAGNESIAHATPSLGPDGSIHGSAAANRSDEGVLRGILQHQMTNGTAAQKAAASNALAIVNGSGPLAVKLREAISTYNHALAAGAAGGGASRQEIEEAKAQAAQAQAQAEKDAAEAARANAVAQQNAATAAHAQAAAQLAHERAEAEAASRQQAEKKTREAEEETANLKRMFNMPQDELAKLVNAAQQQMNNFSRDLFHMKFTGDEQQDFVAQLDKISKQVKAAAKLKTGYEKDHKDIKRLDIYLQFPAQATDTRPMIGIFLNQTSTLTEAIEHKLDNLKRHIAEVQNGLQTLRHHNGIGEAEKNAQRAINKYRFGQKGGEGEEAAEESDTYKKIFDAAESLEKYVSHVLNNFLKGPIENPTDFAKKYDDLVKDMESHKEYDLSDIYNKIVGKTVKRPGQKEEERGGHTDALKTALSLYFTLENALQSLADLSPFKHNLTLLLTSTDEMRRTAAELIGFFRKERSFEKSAQDETTPEPAYPKVTISSLLDDCQKYKAIEEENALVRYLEHYEGEEKKEEELARANIVHEVDFEQIKAINGRQKKTQDDLANALGALKKNWTDNHKEKQFLFAVHGQKKGLIASILQSDLYPENKKIEAALAASKPDPFASHITKFKKLTDKNNETKELLTVFNLSKREAERREKESEQNKKEKKEQKAYPIYPTFLDTEIFALIKGMSKKYKTFQDAWRAETPQKGNALGRIETKLAHNLAIDPNFHEFCEKVFQESRVSEQGIFSLAEKVVYAQEKHSDFMEKIKALRGALHHILPSPKEIPDNIHNVIKNKLSELLETIYRHENYLSLDPAARAKRYAYNFPMFFDEDLQPEENQEIWGNDPHKKRLQTDLYNALQAAYTAYIDARDAIQQINPKAQERGREQHTRIFGGFENLKPHEAPDAGGALGVPGAPPVPGGIPGAPPVPGGGIPGAPPVPGGGIPGAPPAPALQGARGHVKAAAAQQQDPEKVIRSCNKCVADIEGYINREVMPKIVDAQGQPLGLGTPQYNKVSAHLLTSKKNSILADIITSLEADFDHMDRPAPDMNRLITVIDQSCKKTHVIEKAPEDIREAQEVLRAKKAALGDDEERKDAGNQDFYQNRLRPGQKKIQGEPFTLENGEEQLFNIQDKIQNKENISEDDKNKERLKAIKDAGLTHVGKPLADYTDEQLLAFHIDLLTQIKPADIQNFTPEELESLRKSRFNQFNRSHGSFESINEKLLKAYEKQNVQGFGNPLPGVPGATYPTISEALARFDHTAMVDCLRLGRCNFKLKIVE